MLKGMLKDIYKESCRLKDCELYREDGNYYLRPTYIVENAQEIAEITLHKVELPLMRDACIINYHLYETTLNLYNDIELQVDKDKYGAVFTKKVIEHKVHELTMDEVEKKLGHKVKIVPKEEQHIICYETCKKCVHHGKNECGEISCDTCKSRYGWDRCRCAEWNEGEPCPYFKEAE